MECEVKRALGNITMNKASWGDGIPAELLKIRKDDAVKVLYSISQQIWNTQQWSQDWKRSVFSFQSQRRAMPKNVQLPHSCTHFMSCSKFSKLGFNGMWPKNFQVYKVGVWEADELEIKLPTFIGLWRKQGGSRKISTSASLTILKPLSGSQKLENS